jgi:hypothetical protein
MGVEEGWVSRRDGCRGDGCRGETGVEERWVSRRGRENVEESVVVVKNWWIAEESGR